MWKLLKTTSSLLPNLFAALFPIIFGKYLKLFFICVWIRSILNPYYLPNCLSPISKQLLFFVVFMFLQYRKRSFCEFLLSLYILFSRRYFDERKELPCEKRRDMGFMKMAQPQQLFEYSVPWWMHKTRKWVSVACSESLF